MMRTRAWIISLWLLPLLATGCIARPTGGASAPVREEEREFRVDFPAIVLEYERVGSVSLAMLPRFLRPLAAPLLPLGGLTLDQETMERLVAGNVQHLQLDSHAQGVTLLANGQPVFGSLRYTEGDLDNLPRLVAILTGSGAADGGGAPLGAVSQLLPLLDNLGLGIVLKFPVAPDQALIPLADASAVRILSDAELLANEAAAQAGGIASIPVTVAADGSFSSTNAMFSMLMVLVPAETELKFPEDFLAQMDALGIDQFSLRTRNVGLTLGFNGQNLPLLTWNNGELENLLALANSADLWSQIAPDMDEGVRATLLDTLLPVLQGANFDITMDFP